MRTHGEGRSCARWMLWLCLASAACQTEAAQAPPVQPAPEKTTETGMLVSPDLLELAGRWSRDSLLGKVRADEPDLASYIRSRRPDLADEVARVVGPRSSTTVVANQLGDCSCSVWGAISGYGVTSNSGPGWTASHSGAAHTSHMYQEQSGSIGETTANLAPHTTRLATRIICTTPQGAACSAGCSAQLYADALYDASVYAESHTWTIWNKAGSIQGSDGATLDLRTPYGGAGTRLFEKAVSADHNASGTTFDVNELANAIKAGLGIAAAIDSDPAVIPALTAQLVKSVMGIVQRNDGTNGNVTQQINATYSTVYDAVAPIPISYSASDINAYALDLTSQINMKARGYGYHSETAELRSSYSLAAYVTSFVCDGGVTSVPLSTGFWRYDAYSGAPVGVATLQSQISGFLQIATGHPVPVTSSQGTVQLGACGDQVCDSFEGPSSCPSDCGSCGDGVCNYRFENSSNCAQDCNYCGDGVCYGSEDIDSCIEDCGYCGDGYCSSAEFNGWCPSDCGYCGDGICGGYEDSSSCPSDCCPPGQICAIQ